MQTKTTDRCTRMARAPIAADGKRIAAAFAFVRMLSVLALFAACGADCVSFGGPSVRLSAVDARTGAHIPLASAMLAYTNTTNLSDNHVLTGQPIPSSWPAGEPYTICCVAGTLRLQLTIAGYATADTIFVVQTSGACETPLPVALELRLMPLAEKVLEVPTVPSSRPDVVALPRPSRSAAFA